MFWDIFLLHSDEFHLCSITLVAVDNDKLEFLATPISEWCFNFRALNLKHETRVPKSDL